MSDAPDDDADAWLGRLLDEFVRAVADGEEPDLAGARSARPELAADIDDTARLAQTIAPRRPAQRPTVAGYAILRELGRGGMGTVYVAEHERLARRVALKLLPARFAADGKARARFLREARAVARLDHERIVRVFDVGEEDGTPWFTMELVDGETLAATVERLRASGVRPAELAAADLARAARCAEFEDARYAPAVARVGLDLARALEHAHAGGVVHRDVKPSNAIVRRDGRAQLFDFGLASIEAEQSLTLSGAFLGTPHYASPEQASGAELDPRSDVYSLGATLYELVALEPPFRGATTAEVLRRVQDEDPPRPRAANASVPRDLETILATAMAKEPSRRYLSAAALAADLEAFLDGRPIAARPVGPATRFVRRVRRNPLPAALVLALVALPTLLYAQQRAANVEIRAARDAAEEALADSRAHNEFVGSVLRSPDPDRSGRDVRVVDVLEQAEADLEERFADRPGLHLSLLTMIADTYGALGVLEGSQRVQTRLLELARAHLGAGSPEALDAATKLAWTAYLKGRADEGLALLDEALPAARAALAPDHPVLQRSDLARCVLLTTVGRGREALEGLDRLIAVLEPLRDRQRQLLHEALHNRALVLSTLGRTDEAVAAAERVYLERMESDGAEATATLDSAGLYAQLLGEAGRREEALTLLESALDASERVYGPDSPNVVSLLHNLAGCWMDEGDLELADALQRRALEIASEHLRDEGWILAECRRQLARIALARGEADEAEAILREALESSAAAAGSPSRRSVLEDLAELLARTGRAGEAAELRATE